MRFSWTNIHNIMLKLCLNPNYKQVLGELSRPVSTGSTPGHCAHKGFFLIQFKINLEDNHQVCVGKGILHVFYDVLNSVIDFMMMKRCHMPTCVKTMLSSGEILRTLFCTLVKWHGVINLYTLKKYPVEAG